MTSHDWSIVAFLLSVTISFSTSTLLCSHLTTEARPRFWIFTLSTALQLGIISQVASLLGKLEPLTWLGLQLALLFLVVTVCRNATPWAGRSEHILAPQSILAALHRWRGFVLSLSAPFLILFLALSALILSSGMDQLLKPLTGYDERMYHASRVLYWLQNQSILPYPTHNDRQTVFGFGGELFFLWPILFTKSELIGRMVFWTGYPIAVFALYILLRELEMSRELALVGAFLFVVTPIVAAQSIGLKPELWHVVFVLGTAFWTVRACKDSGTMTTSLFFAALFVSFSVHIKSTALPLLASVLFLPWLTPRNVPIARKVAATGSGTLVGILLSGLLVTSGFNLANYGHVLGPEPLRKVVGSDLSPQQFYTHAVRFTFLLLELPAVPLPSVQNFFSDLGNEIMNAIGAGDPLPGERKNGWPGVYVYQLPGVADNFSLGGLVWLPFLLIGVGFLVRNFTTTYPRVELAPLSAVVLLELPLLCGIVFLARWMVTATVPERYLLPPYALSLAITLLVSRRMIEGSFHKHRIAVLAVVLLILMLPSALRLEVPRLWAAISTDDWRHRSDEPFTEALTHIPAGSRVLLVGSQAVRDYPLFAPRSAYSNSVTSWGKSPFDPRRIQELVEKNHITHILIENDRVLGFHWDPPMSTSEMVSWLAESSYFVEKSLATQGMRLFQTALGERGHGVKVRRDEPPHPIYALTGYTGRHT